MKKQDYTYCIPKLPAGELTMSEEQLTRREVVTAFLRHKDRFLIVKRSDKVGSYQGKWSAISGYLEDPIPLQQALREIREETGLRKNAVHLAAQAACLEIPAPKYHTCWVVHPFLFDLDSVSDIKLDWENLSLQWVTKQELSHYPTVPALAEALQACLKNEQCRNRHPA